MIPAEGPSLGIAPRNVNVSVVLFKCFGIDIKLIGMRTDIFHC